MKTEQTIAPEAILIQQKKKCLKLRTSTADDRVQKLRALRRCLINHRESLQKALYSDFQKPQAETDLTEFYLVKAEIDLAIKNLRQWMNPKPVDTPLSLIGSKSYVQFEPKGTCLIIGPWNYPFSLIIGPLVSAIAAGNTAILKPSEMTNHTSTLIREMIEETFEQDEVYVFEGGIDVATQLLRMPFDHIFFTGSPTVGKIVMKAASQNLTSVTLELGGKSPNIIDESANLKDAVEKLVFNKFLNAGQTCIAPDHVLVHSKVHDKFLRLLKVRIAQVYGQNPTHLAGIVSVSHLGHLKNLYQNALDNGALLECGGEFDTDQTRLSPTVLSHVTWDMAIMEEEIFGPILPVLKIDDIEDAIREINQRAKPLALYIFSKNTKNVDKVLMETSSGTACINDGDIQFSNNFLPFGGVNNSGMGKSHGHYGFMTFSNEKGVLKQRIGMTSLKALYPPYTNRVRKYIDLLLKWL